MFNAFINTLQCRCKHNIVDSPAHRPFVKQVIQISKKGNIKSQHYYDVMRGIHIGGCWPVVSLPNEPVMRKSVLCHDVITSFLVLLFLQLPVLRNTPYDR